MVFLHWPEDNPKKPVYARQKGGCAALLPQEGRADCGDYGDY